MKNLRLLICIGTTMLLSFTMCKAQDYQPGYAILTDGTRISGLISVYTDAPWYNQRFIYVKDSAAVAAKPNGNVPTKKYRADDLKFYQIGDRKFDKVHYVDMQNLQLKSFGTNDHMLERVSMGKITAHRFYAYPKDIEAGWSEDDLRQKMAKEKSDLIHGYLILTMKEGDTKLRNAFDYDLQKYFEDTPEVLEKYQTGGYGNEPVVKKGFGAKMMAMARKAAFKPQEADAIAMAFNDYNSKNPSK